MSITGSVPGILEQVQEYVASENIPAGSVVCLSETEDKVYMAQAISWTRMPAIGITKNAANAGDIVKVYQFGVVTNVSRTEDFSYDDPIYVSETAGKATKVPIQEVGKIFQQIGQAKNSSDITLWFEEAIEIGG